MANVLAAHFVCHLSGWRKSTRVDSTRGSSRGCSGSSPGTRWEPQPCPPRCWCWWARSPPSRRSRRASTAAGRVATSASFPRRQSPLHRSEITGGGRGGWKRCRWKRCEPQTVCQRADYVNTAATWWLRTWRQSPKVTFTWVQLQKKSFIWIRSIRIWKSQCFCYPGSDNPRYFYLHR